MQRLIATVTFLVLVLIFAIPFSTMADCEVTLQWDPNSEPDIAGYKLFMRTEGSTYDFTWPEWQGSTNQCAVSELDENTTYYFVVRAVDSADNESGDSNEVRFRSADDNNAGLSQAPNIASAPSSSGGCFIESLFAQ